MITHVQTVFNTTAVSLPGTGKAGHLLIVSVEDRTGGSHTAHSVTSANGQTWTKIDGDDTELANASHRRSFSTWYRIGLDGDDTIVGVSPTGASTRWAVSESSTDTGAFTYAAHAKNNNGATNNDTSLSTGSTASTSGNQLVYVFVGMRKGTETIADIAFTNGLVVSGSDQAGSNTVFVAVGWTESSDAGAKESTASWTGANSGANAAILVFNTDGGGGGGGGASPLLKRMLSEGKWAA